MLSPLTNRIFFESFSFKAVTTSPLSQIKQPKALSGINPKPFTYESQMAVTEMESGGT